MQILIKLENHALLVPIAKLIPLNAEITDSDNKAANSTALNNCDIIYLDSSGWRYIPGLHINIFL